MNPEQPPLQQPAIKKSYKGLALLLLVGPSVLILGSTVLYAIMSSLYAATHPDMAGFGEQPMFLTLANLALFIFGGAGFITLLPGLIIGIILLARKK